MTRKKINLLAGAIIVAIFVLGCDTTTDPVVELPANADVKNINVVYAIASVPNIVATLEICKDNSPTLFYQERDICDLQAMPKNVVATGVISNSVSESNRMLDVVKSNISIMHNLYPEAKFTLYLNDCYLGTHPIYFFEKQGIKNYEVISITDGTGSYSNRFSQFDTIEEYNAIDISKYEDSSKLSRDEPYCMKLALENSKYKWFLQFPEFLKEYTEDEQIKALIDKGIAENKIVKYDIPKNYASLSDEQKNTFKKAMRYDLDEYVELFTLEQGKKGMMIVGGSDSAMGTGKYQVVIEKLIQKFGAENYNYYFKPHPMFPPAKLSAYNEKSAVDFFAEKNIKTIPAALPSDVTMVIYADSFDCGGYYGSTFMTVPERTVKFFFNDKNVISTATKPLDKMFEHKLLDADKIEWIVAE